MIKTYWAWSKIKRIKKINYKNILILACNIIINKYYISF